MSKIIIMNNNLGKKKKKEKFNEKGKFIRRK